MGESSWKKTQLNADKSSPNGDEPLPLPTGWKKYRDPASGNVYYANKKTGESSWDRPKPDPKQPASIEAKDGKSTDNVGQSRVHISEVQKTVSFSTEFQLHEYNDELNSVISSVDPSRKLLRAKSKTTSEKSSFSRPSKFIHHNDARKKKALLNKLTTESPDENSLSRQFKFGLKGQKKSAFPEIKCDHNSSSLSTDKPEKAGSKLLPAIWSKSERPNKNLLPHDLSSNQSDPVKITTASGLEIAPLLITRSKCIESTELLLVPPGSNDSVPIISFLSSRKSRTPNNLVTSSTTGPLLSMQKSIKKIFPLSKSPEKTSCSTLQIVEPHKPSLARLTESTMKLVSPSDTSSKLPSVFSLSVKDEFESCDSDKMTALTSSSRVGDKLNVKEEKSQVKPVAETKSNESIVCMDSMTQAKNTSLAFSALSPPPEELICQSFLEQDQNEVRDRENKQNMILNKTHGSNNTKSNASNAVVVNVDTAYKDKFETANAVDEDSATQLSGSSSSLSQLDLGNSGWVVDDVGEENIPLHESRCGDCGLSQAIHDHLLFVGGFIFSLVGKPSQEMRKNMEDVGDLFADEVSEDGSECRLFCKEIEN